jgi:TPR repeat protein
MRNFFAIFLIWAALGTPKALAQATAIATQQLGSSFDCRRDNGAIPRLVCNDDELRLLDLEQLKLYYTLRHALPQSQQDLRSAYLDAIERIKTQCTAANAQARACVISGLNALRQHWLSIIQSTANQSASEEARLDIRQITAAQTGLRERGLLPPNSISDGLLGTATRSALGRLQAEHGQPANGFLNAETTRLLRTTQTNASPRQQTVQSPGMAQQQPSTLPLQTTQAAPNRNAATTTNQDTQGQMEAGVRAFDAGDYVTAARIFRDVAQRGNAEAQALLGLLYNNGLGVQQNFEEAERLVAAAAAAGVDGAASLLETIRANIRQVVQNRAQQEQLVQSRAREEQIRQDVQNRAQQEQLGRVRFDALAREYQRREKTVLEQVLNYTETSREEGYFIEENQRILGNFWVSGYGGDHRCILTQFNWFLSRVIPSLQSEPRKIDIRNFNQAGFLIRGPFNNNGVVMYEVGDERTKITASKDIVVERLRNAWGVAFRECPGRRSAF